MKKKRGRNANLQKSDDEIIHTATSLKDIECSLANGQQWGKYKALPIQEMDPPTVSSLYMSISSPIASVLILS